MRITGLETIPVDIPLKPAVAIRGSKGMHDRSPFLLLRLHTDEGITGLGEVSATPRWSGEDAVTAAHFLETLIAPQIAGQNTADIGNITRIMNRTLAGNWFTKAAVEMALWDIAGKAAGAPAFRLLGGPLRDFVPTKWSVSGVEPAKAARIAAWAVEQGFRYLKVKVGIEAEQDVERVRAVREAVGPEVRLGVDANGGWSPAEAVYAIRRIEDLGIVFAEQPVPPGDPEAMAQVRRQVRVPILADESVYTVEDARALARAGAADAVSVYVGKSGGIGTALEIMAAAGAAGMGATIGSNLELGVASAAMIHLALAAPDLATDLYPCDIIGPLYYEDDVIEEPLPIRPGEARATGRPGLGVELDEAKVHRYRAG